MKTKQHIVPINEFGFRKFNPEYAKIELEGCLFAKKIIMEDHKLKFYTVSHYDEYEVFNIKEIYLILENREGESVAYTHAYVLEKTHLLGPSNDDIRNACVAIDADLEHLALNLFAIMGIINEKLDAQNEMPVSECFDQGAIFYIESFEVHTDLKKDDVEHIMLHNTLTFLDKEYGVRRRLAFNKTPYKYYYGELDFTTQDEINQFLKESSELNEFIQRVLKQHYADSFYVNMDMHFEIHSSTFQHKTVPSLPSDKGDDHPPYLM